jgi:hypothetical protein
MTEHQQKYEQLVVAEDEVLKKINTCQKVISAIFDCIIHKGHTLHALTVQDALEAIHTIEQVNQTQLLQLRREKCFWR